MKKFHTILAIALSALSSAPAAAATTGFYVAGQFGDARLTDKSVNHAAYGVDGKILTDAGYSASVAAGYALPYNFRAEAEATLISGLNGSVYDPIGGGAGIGRRKALYGMINAYYDIPTGYALRPYIGLGGGIVRATTNVDVDLGGGFTVTIDDTDTAWAWQAIGGVSYDLTSNAVLTLDYRSVQTGNLHHPTKLNGAPLSSMTMNAGSQSIRTGVRWSF